MSTLENQLVYWNSTDTAKTFTHPVEFVWLDGLDREARILDYGCGYGRIAGLLRDLGFHGVEGVDIAPNLVERARIQWPAVSFDVLDAPPALPHAYASVDAVLLFAVLTCVPTDEGQEQLITELLRLLRPGGILYLSDLCLQDDQRNRARYEAFAAKYGTFGVFETDDGAVCRHHTMDRFDRLLGGFELVTAREISVDTMNGRPAKAVQMLASKPS
jgi:SAM-dependent methyltransferase